MSTEPEIVTLETQRTAVVKGKVPMAELPAFFDGAFGRLAEAIEAQGAGITGPAFAYHHRQPTDVADLEIGFPTQRSIAPDGEVVPSALPGARAARLVHEGAFDTLGESWGRLAGWITEQGLAPGPSMWEVYLVEPSPEMDPADLRTELVWPVSG